MERYREQDKDLIFALDIGTRSIVGIVGKPVGQRLKVLAMESAEHDRRVMMDGQIDDIGQVADLARAVTQRLESQLEVRLRRVCVAAAGRALRTQRGSFSMELTSGRPITQAEVGQLEAGAVSAAEEALKEDEDSRRQLFLVGYTVAQYRLDNYPLNTLIHHNGQKADVDVVATFLPGEVVESLYSAMNAAGLSVASMTLEPIAAMNAAIPADLRLLNLALVDIGAGTTDIALCRDGSVVGYTMVTLAGDEVTESIMRALLVDFQTAEHIKRALEQGEDISYTDVLGIEETVTPDAVFNAIGEQADRLADAIAQQVCEINGGPPSALFLAGGGSKLATLRERVAKSLGINGKRVAIAGNNFVKSVFSDQIDLNNAELTTPLGIAVSAGMGLLNDSYVVTLNDQPAKLFRSGSLTLQDILLMNGYLYSDMLGRTGGNLAVTVDGRRKVFRGEPAVPAILEVNGENATLGTVIHAGDQIRFVPARPGTTPSMTLGELLGEDFSGSALVNNQPAALSRPLASGDVILTSDKPAAEPPKEAPAPEVQRQEPSRQEAPVFPATRPVSAVPPELRAARPSAVRREERRAPTEKAEKSPVRQEKPISVVPAAGEQRPEEPVRSGAPEPEAERPEGFALGSLSGLMSLSGGGVGAAFFGGGTETQPEGQKKPRPEAEAGLKTAQSAADIREERGAEPEAPAEAPQPAASEIGRQEAPAQPEASARTEIKAETAVPAVPARQEGAEKPLPNVTRITAEDMLQAMELNRAFSAKEKQAEVPPPRRTIQITLNEKALALPPKADGTPYYLMDLLDFTGIDFQHLERPVRLAVNGEESGFRREIAEGDRVDIVQM